MRDKLKPCPFCGGRPHEYIEGGSIVIRCSSSAESAARCGCGARIAMALLPSGEWEMVPPKARAAWNRRTERKEP